MGAWVRVAEASPEQRERQRQYERDRARSHGRRSGRGCCKRCAGLAHRVEGNECVKCGLAYQAEGTKTQC